ncbi:MAG: hypothetical protein KAR07_07870 [Spirochaetes bacterium]|nr:hypothetical protein [Spirochaetota bacterium]
MKNLKLLIYSFLILYINCFNLTASDASTLKAIFRILKDSKIQYQFKASLLKTKKQFPSSVRVYSRKTSQNIITAKSLTRKGKYKNALKILETILLNDKDDYFINYRIGNIHRLINQMKDAQKYFFRSILLNRNFKRSWQALKKTGINFNNRKKVIERAWILHYSPETVQIHYDKNYKKSGKHYPWLTFAMARALWRFENYYKTAYPNALWYRSSFKENLFCYKLLIYSWEKAKKTRKYLKDEDLDYLILLKKNNMLPGYVFIEAYSPKIEKHNRYILKKYKKSILSYLTFITTDPDRDKPPFKIEF